MRIIAGTFKGRRLQSPRGEQTRPTTDRVRESIFNLLSVRIAFDETAVLDLFCGTGAFGLESISRGADQAVFVDLGRAALQNAAGNAAALGVEVHCRFLRRDVLRYLKSLPETHFDIIFADPPYEMVGIPDIPRHAIELLNPSGLLVLEHDVRHSFDEEPFCIESRSYGRTVVTIFQASSNHG